MPARSRLLVVDTNVLVGGVLSMNAVDPMARLVAAMRAGSLGTVVSAPLVAEYRNVLLRPKLVRRHGWADEVVDALIHALCAHATVVAPHAGRRAPDPGDQMLWDLLTACDDLRLVTADKALLRDRGMIGRVVTAEQAVCAVARLLP